MADALGGVPVPKLMPMHFAGAATFEGAKIAATALEGAYRGVSAENFGSTMVKLPTADGTVKEVQVRDMHYDLGNGKVGMRLIPVSDSGTVKDATGQEVPGNTLMDAHIRKEMKLGENDPIFALIAYVHPEEHSGDMKQLASEMVKTEMGSTHMGAYVGAGRTTNSPENYHSNRWNVRGYPANVQQVSLKDVPQALLNKNMLNADGVLNKGVEFPSDYKNDKFRTTDLNTTLQFYRDWIKGEPYLKSDNSWATYCAEHKTVVTNVGLNVPHNEASFKEIFGETEGPALWTQYKAKFQAANGREFTAADETNFEPLWKKEGLTADQIRPMTKEQYEAYETARFAGTLASYTGPKPLAPGKALAWKPETTADLVHDFMETYARFDKVGGFSSAATILGFKDTVKERMGMSDEKFLAQAMPVVNKVMVAEAMARAPADPAQMGEWMAKTTAGLYLAFGGKSEDLAPTGTKNPQIWGLAEASMQGAAGASAQVAQLAQLPAARRNEEAYAWLRESVKSDVETARATAVSDPSKVEFYSPPAVAHRVAAGLHEASPFVNIRVIGTAIDASEVAQ